MLRKWTVKHVVKAPAAAKTPRVQTGGRGVGDVEWVASALESKRFYKAGSVDKFCQSM